MLVGAGHLIQQNPPPLSSARGHEGQPGPAHRVAGLETGRDPPSSARMKAKSTDAEPLCVSFSFGHACLCSRRGTHHLIVPVTLRSTFVWAVEEGSCRAAIMYCGVWGWRMETRVERVSRLSTSCRLYWAVRGRGQPAWGLRPVTSAQSSRSATSEP